MSSALYCTCMVFGILVVCPETDGNQLTWNEPLPILTVQESDANQVVHRNHTRLIEGTINASLSWYFNLSSGLFFNSLNLKLKTDVIAVVNSRRKEVLAGFKDKYAINWSPSQRITLMFFKVTTEQNAIFACEVFAIDTFVSIWRSHVQVDVVAPPNNIVVSSDQIIAAPAELTLNCSADGKPTPTITWTRVSDNTVIFMPLNITGGKNAESYRCTADNGIGKPLTKVVNISILYQASITFISANQTVNGGDLLLLDCLASGTPLPSITWTRLTDNKLVDMPLTITGKQDEGGYRCTAYNKVGNPAASDVFITVHSYHPYNTFLSTNLTNAASLNKIFYLICNAVANPAAEYRLYKEDESIANITTGSQNIGIYATSVGERINQVVYKCIPFNSFGDGPTKTITVSVHYPVEATGKGENATVPEGGQKVFSCPVNGNPEPNIEWYSEKTGRKISCERHVEVKESGCYTCIASNSIGTPINITQCLIVGKSARLIR